MKKVIAILMIMVFVVASFAMTVSAASAPVKLVINGTVDTSSPSAYIDSSSGRTMVPIRVISEGLGATVTWDATTSTATIVMNSKTIVIKAGSSTATVNGVQVALDAPAVIVSDRLFVPLRFVAENLGITVVWFGSSTTVAVCNKTMTYTDSAGNYINTNGKANNITIYGSGNSLTVTGSNNKIYLSGTNNTVSVSSSGQNINLTNNNNCVISF